MIGPVNASISSTDKPIFACTCMMAIMPNTPMRLAMKAGVSLQSTVVLPKKRSPKSIRNSTTVRSVSGVGMISNNRR